MSQAFQYQSWVYGPRWAGLESFLRKGAITFGVDFVIDHRDTGWIRETLFYTVTGDRASVEAFEKAVESSLKEWNERGKENAKA